MNIRDLLAIGALIQLQRWDAALDEVDRQLASAPGDGHALRFRAIALLGLGRYAEALDAIDRALAVEPAAVSNLLLRAEALRCLDRRHDAIVAAERVAALAPNDEAVRICLARCQLLAHRRREAEQTAAAVVADNPASVDGWIALGETRLGRHNASGGVEAFERALALDPTSAAATNGLGVAYQRLGRRRDAASMYAQAARIDPHETTPRQNLERLAGLGGLGIVVIVAVQVVRQRSPLTAIAVLAILAAVATPIVVLLRRKRLADLPPDGRAFVVSQRRARRRRIRDPRNWPGLVRANPRGAVFGLGLVAVFAVLVAIGPSSGPTDRRPDIDLDPEDFEVSTPLFSQTTLPNVVLRCSDGSTVPLRAGADIFGCDDFTIVSGLRSGSAQRVSVGP